MALLLLIIVWGGLVSAPASSQSGSRVNSLELDIRGIQSRLSRIESQLNRSGGGPTPAASPPSNNTGRYRQGLSGDPMFDRLATLAIELRERINQLDTRVSNLESKGGPRANQ